MWVECASIWVNILKTSFSLSSGIPMPLSLTATTIMTPSFLISTTIFPDSFVYLVALWMILEKIWLKRALSPYTVTSSSRQLTVISCFFAFTCCSTISRESESTSWIFNLSNSSLTFPRVMRDTSIKSLISLDIYSAWRLMIAVTLFRVFSSSTVSRILAPDIIGPNGFRSSWANVARNSFL